jgi:hypothetical protein
MLNSLFDEGVTPDVLEKFTNFTRRFYRKGQIEYIPINDIDQITAAMVSARHALRKLPNPSIFKKAAVFTHYFVSLAPITTDFPEGSYPPELKRRYYHNAVIAYEFCVASIVGATIKCPDKPDKTLDFPIKISKHQHKEFMAALCEISPELKDTYTRLIALIYETLSYEFNDGVRYPDEPKEE